MDVFWRNSVMFYKTMFFVFLVWGGGGCHPLDLPLRGRQFRAGFSIHCSTHPALGIQRATYLHFTETVILERNYRSWNPAGNRSPVTIFCKPICRSTFCIRSSTVDGGSPTRVLMARRFNWSEMARKAMQWLIKRVSWRVPGACVRQEEGMNHPAGAWRRMRWGRTTTRFQFDTGSKFNLVNGSRLWREQLGEEIIFTAH